MVFVVIERVGLQEAALRLEPLMRKHAAVDGD
jgi:hypothetical protein